MVGCRLVWVTSAGTLARRHRGDVAQRDRPLLRRAGDRHVQQRLDRLDVLLGILHADVILVVADRVDPEVLLVELDAGVERGDQVLHHVDLGQAQVGGLGLVDVDDVLGIVEPLHDAAVDHAVDLRRPSAGSPRRPAWAFSRFLPVMRMLMRRRLALVHGAADHAAGVEGELQVAELAGRRRSRSRSRWTYSWAERSRSWLSWTLTTASIGPALGV